MKMVTQVTSFHFMNSCCWFTTEEAVTNNHGQSPVEKKSGGLIFELYASKHGLRDNQSSYLLWVVGHVGQHGGHVEHDLVALVGGVQRVGARRVRWGKKCSCFMSDIILQMSPNTLWFKQMFF